MHLFTQQYPQIRVDVVLSQQVVDLIDNSVHAAIRLGTPEPSGLIARPLMDFTLTICAALLPGTPGSAPHAGRTEPTRPPDLRLPRRR